LNAQFAEFLTQFSKEETVAITLGLARVESVCFRLRAMVFYQGGRRMTLTGKEAPDLSAEQTAFPCLLAALTWERPYEKLFIRWRLRPS
jgi:hypothetical protein